MWGYSQQHAGANDYLLSTKLFLNRSLVFIWETNPIWKCFHNLFGRLGQAGGKLIHTLRCSHYLFYADWGWVISCNLTCQQTIYSLEETTESLADEQINKTNIVCTNLCTLCLGDAPGLERWLRSPELYWSCRRPEFVSHYLCHVVLSCL